MLIGVITYDINHLKTEQILFGFLSQNYEVKIYLLPFVERPQRAIAFNHRPNFLLGAHPREIAKKYDLEIQDISNDKYLVSEADYLIVGGAGVLSENIINQNQVINCHPGIIPISRGLDSFKWAILENKRLGVTLHMIDKEVDSGEVIKVKETDVFKSDSIESLARRHYENEINLLLKFEDYIKCPSNIYSNNKVGIRKKRMSIEKEEEMTKKFEKYAIDFAS
jgi:phosphoribosylglycinamide formyltransferase 1